MKTENQVITLEQAKRLKELGVNASANLKFIEYEEGKYWLKRVRGVLPTYNAYNVAELGVMIDWERFNIMPPNKHTNEWRIDDEGYIGYSNTNEAILRGDILIYQLEQGITTAEKVNERLNNA